MEPFLLLTANLTGTSRHAKLHGQDFLVVPMVILMEGVHNGSNGPLFYPEKELLKSVPNWNHKPLVVYHPTHNGTPISACDADVLEARGVGMVMNTKYIKGKTMPTKKRIKGSTFNREPGKLVAEAWFNVEQLKKVDERVLMNIESDENTEVSTGLIADYITENGNWRGEEYDAMAVNYRADHVAILPDQEGACSIKDGCGLGGELVGNCGCGGGKPSIVNALTSNDMSYSNISSALYAWVSNKYGDRAYVMDVYPKFFIFCNGGEYYKVGYTVDDVEVSVSTDKPVKVVRVTEYRTEDGAYVGNVSKQFSIKEFITMDKDEMINALISNTSNKWGEDDREFLDTLDEKALTRLAEVVNVETESDPPAKPEKTVNKKTAKKPTVAETVKKVGQAAGIPVANDAEGDPEDLEAYLENAQIPAAVRNALRASIDAEKEQRAELIEKIMANADDYTEEELDEFKTPQLKKIANTLTNLAKAAEDKKPKRANYGGAGGGVAQAPTDNASGSETPLVMPQLFANSN